MKGVYLCVIDERVVFILCANCSSQIQISIVLLFLKEDFSMKKILVTILSLILVLGLATSCSSDSDAGAEGPIEITIAHTDSDQRSTHLWAVELGNYLEENAPGRFVVEVSPGGALGDTPQLVEGVKLGTITAMFDLSSVVAAGADPEAMLIDLPYLYPTYEDWVEGTFENGGLELFNTALQRSGFYCVDMFYNGMRQVISSEKTYHNADDLAGQKIRIAQNDLNVMIWEEMGAAPTPMAWGEVIASFQTGQIHGMDHALGVFNDYKFYESAPYLTLTNHASSPFPFIVSLDWINSLSEEDRAVFEEGVQYVCAQQRDEERANEATYIETFEAAGVTVEELTEDEVAAFTAAVEPVYDYYRAELGDDVVDNWLATRP